MHWGSPTKETHSGDFTPKERGTETASEGSCSRGVAQFHWGDFLHWGCTMGGKLLFYLEGVWYLYYLEKTVLDVP